jgi:hypothetical protein
MIRQVEAFPDGHGRPVFVDQDGRGAHDKLTAVGFHLVIVVGLI